MTLSNSLDKLRAVQYDRRTAITKRIAYNTKVYILHFGQLWSSHSHTYTAKCECSLFGRRLHTCGGFEAIPSIQNLVQGTCCTQQQLADDHRRAQQGLDLAACCAAANVPGTKEKLRSSVQMLQLMLLVGNIKHRLPSSRPLHQLPPIKVANCGIIQRIVLSKTRMLLGSREQAQGCIFPSCLQLVSFIRFIMAIGWEAHNEVLQHLITTVVFVFILNNNTLVKKISQIKKGICNNTFLGFGHQGKDKHGMPPEDVVPQ